MDMKSTELETSGLQEKKTVANLPVLPDGSRPVPIGSGVTTGILGEGGSAIIYEIKNKQLGLQRAVKLLKPQYTRDTYNRFLREFRITIQLSHPNLAVIHTIGQWNKLPLIEMEKITGFSLSEIVAQFGPLPTGLVSAIGIILCKALEYLHTCTFEIDKKNYHGLLHLDLKPSNILLSDSGVLKIMDFGLSTPIDEVKLGLYPKAGVGSPQYIAPELLLGQGEPDVRSDIYSLGCILYELLSGVQTFPGPGEESVMKMRYSNTFVSLRKLSRTISPDMLQLIENCLNFYKENRPFGIDSVRRELEGIHLKSTRLTPENTIQLYVNQRRHNEPFTLPPPGPGFNSFIRVALILLGASVIILFGGFFAMQKGGIVTSRITDSLSVAKRPSKNKPVSESDLKKPTEPETPATIEEDFYAPVLNSNQSALVDSIRRAWQSRKFDVMLSLIERLPKDLATSKEFVLYKLRALGRSGEELGNILMQTEILDGEYFFHLARFQFGNKNYTQALINLDKALSLPCEFLDKRILGREVQLYKSRSLTSIFRTDPTSENLNAALASWNSLLELVSDRPQGIHGREAKKEKENLLAEAEWRGIE
jgi:serine/threonine protein kinase